MTMPRQRRKTMAAAAEAAVDAEAEAVVVEEDGGAMEVTFEIFENERKQPFRGWGSSYPGHLLPHGSGQVERPRHE